MMPWIFVALWLACATGASWLHANSWPSTHTALEYARGFVIGLFTGPIGLILLFIFYIRRP